MTMKTHILYLSDHKRVCDFPERLGTEIVGSENARVLPNCTYCFALLHKHNRDAADAREHNAQLLMDEDSHPLAPSVGFFVGMAVSLVLWTAILLAWVVWFK